MENLREEGTTGRDRNVQMEDRNLSVKELNRMKQDVMLKRLADYHQANPLFQKINKFFSLFF